MEIAVLNTSGTETGKKVKLSETVFGVEPSDHAIYLDVKQYLANQRTGTHKAKERSEVSGSTKKLHKQKGTGGSRKGSIKSGTMVGGARIHGPRPRDYSFKLNKKLKQLARKSALTYKAKENNITVLESFNIDGPKTKQYLSILNNLKLNTEKTLLVIPDYNDNIYRSSRNLPKAKVMTAKDLNTYEILAANRLILVDTSVSVIEEILNSAK
jgi:large subunit ribosomal protein L4